MASQQAMVLRNAVVQSFQQDDQLSEASAFVSPIQLPEPLINPSAPTVSNPEPISSLPPVPARLRDRIIADIPFSSSSSRGSTISRSHLCMTNPILLRSLQQFVYLGVAPSTCQMYTSGVNLYLQFCSLFNITPYPASSLTLQFFCADLARRVSYKSIKVYLTGIRLAHL